jgi:hypothetical protein
MLSQSNRNFLEQQWENARNQRRFACVTNLSFSCLSLLALTVCLVRIRQATARPRLISLPTQFCGIIDGWLLRVRRLVPAKAHAPWLRMGTEGTRGQARRLGKQRANRQMNVWPFALSLLSRVETCPIPSLNLFAAATHHRPQSAIEITCLFPSPGARCNHGRCVSRGLFVSDRPVAQPRIGAKAVLLLRVRKCLINWWACVKRMAGSSAYVCAISFHFSMRGRHLKIRC